MKHLRLPLSTRSTRNYGNKAVTQIGFGDPNSARMSIRSINESDSIKLSQFYKAAGLQQSLTSTGAQKWITSSNSQPRPTDESRPLKGSNQKTNQSTDVSAQYPVSFSQNKALTKFDCMIKNVNSCKPDKKQSQIAINLNESEEQLRNTLMLE